MFVYLFIYLSIYLCVYLSCILVYQRKLIGGGRGKKRERTIEEEGQCKGKGMKGHITLGGRGGRGREGKGGRQGGREGGRDGKVIRRH